MPSTAKTWNKFATYRDDEAGLAQAKANAAERGMTFTAYLRWLTRRDTTRLAAARRRGAAIDNTDTEE